MAPERRKRKKVIMAKEYKNALVRSLKNKENYHAKPIPPHMKNSIYIFHLLKAFLRLDNGWIVKIGRGLDIYKKQEGDFDPKDLDARRCKKTTVDIFVIPKFNTMEDNEQCNISEEPLEKKTETVKPEPPNNKEPSPKVQNKTLQSSEKQQRQRHNKSSLESSKKSFGIPKSNTLDNIEPCDLPKESLETVRSEPSNNKSSFKESSKKSLLSRILSKFRK